ncbi:MAG: RNA polymerase sigma factor [Armatimonadota bacterium]
MKTNKETVARGHGYARMVLTPEDAEDLMQEFYLRAWGGLKGLRSSQAFWVWLYRIARNAVEVAVHKAVSRPRPNPSPAGEGLFVTATTVLLSRCTPRP